MADQKEPDLREAAALRGIQAFLGQTSCIVLTDIRRWSIGDPLPSDAELLHLAAGSSPVPERVFVLVRELGPRLEIGIPVIVQGGTEVLIEVRVLDTHSATPLADTRTLWRNGGTFVIKGVKTLDSGAGRHADARCSGEIGCAGIGLLFFVKADHLSH